MPKNIKKLLKRVLAILMKGYEIIIKNKSLISVWVLHHSFFSMFTP